MRFNLRSAIAPLRSVDSPLRAPPQFPNHTLPGAIASEVDQPIVLMVVQAIDGVVQAPLAVFAIGVRGERAINAERPVLLFESAQDQMLIRSALSKAFDKSPAKPQLAEITVIMRPGERRRAACPSAG